MEALSPSHELNPADQRSGAEMLAEFHLLALRGYGEVEIGDDEESQDFAAEIERLNPDWQPGEIPKVPAGCQDGAALRDPAATPPELVAWREAKIREHGDWAYWPDDTLKADWLLRMGPEAWEANQRAVRRNMLKNKARMERLRRQGYWFDEERRLQAPVTPRAEAPAAVVSRPREHRSRGSQRSGPRGDPSPSEPEPPPLRVVPVSRFRRDVRRWLEGAA